MGEILVRKGDGRLEPLDYNKVRRALRSSGASSQIANEVIDSIASSVYQNMPTSEIYRLAFDSLQAMKPGAAARFGLKNALLRLGPDGYPFETFMGSLLKGRGYSTALRQIVPGKCIPHEVDVVAERGHYRGHKPTKFIAECKFHNSPHFQCHIQSALYTWARFLDINARNPKIDSAWLATNTRFSRDVITYGDCVGLKLLGWSFPQDESIQVRIEENRLYPITLMPRMDRKTFSLLHSAGIILVKDVVSAPVERLRELRLGEREIEKLKGEARMVLSARQ